MPGPANNQLSSTRERPAWILLSITYQLIGTITSGYDSGVVLSRAAYPRGRPIP